MPRKQRKLYGLVLSLALLAAAFTATASAETLACHAGPPSDDGYGSPTLIDCPAEMKVLIERQYGCQHWVDEEPYDAARAAQINAALDTLQCGQLEADISAMRARYMKRRDVLATLTFVMQSFQ